ncbi:hypothetical protein JBE04_39895 [Streptomyces sp. PRKS01-29]|nr:hypothetical protein [Streptomyces sabulosicollis]MBI0300459.1 hypothetical protein [Streptomyces sabulosicollis]
MTLTDSCPRCLRRGIAPTATRRDGQQLVHSYRCRCGHRWTTSRLTPAYRHLHAVDTRKAA